MNAEFDLSPAADLPRQRSLLQAILPVLAALDSLDAIFLSGSLARLDADNWSSVDICIMWRMDGPAATASWQREQLQGALDRALGKRGYLLGLSPGNEETCRLAGITLTACSNSGSGGRPVASGVLFRLFWAVTASDFELWRRTGPVRPLYLSRRLSPDLRASLQGCARVLGPADPAAIAAQLGQFWLSLAQLPAVIERREDLAAHALLAETRALLLDLVVALNGAARPRSTARINQFLGPRQRDAFEKTLDMGRTGPGPGSPRASWIGQAVALVVLYRWYAPQLCEICAKPYPQEAEDTVLALLQAQIDGWPAVIETG